MERLPDQKKALERMQQPISDEATFFEGSQGPHGTRLSGSPPDSNETNRILAEEGSSSSATRPQHCFADRLPIELIRAPFVFRQNQTSEAESSSQPVFGMGRMQGREESEEFDVEKGDERLDKSREKKYNDISVEMQESLGSFVNRMEHAFGEIKEVIADISEELQRQDLGQLKEAITEETQKAVKKLKEQIEESQEVLPKLREEGEDLLVHAFRNIRDELVRDIRLELSPPIIRAIQEVKSDVASVQQTVFQSYQETMKATLMANITLEQLCPFAHLDLVLNDRIGQEALTLADDFVKHEPIFLLDRHYSHRIRVSLAHKHQGDAKNFKIKYISVKPADGIELGLRTTETLHPSEGSEVVALFPWDLMQSSGLSSSCSQVGMVEEKYVDVAVVIGVDVTADKTSSKMKHLIEMKGRILCLPVSGSKHMSFRKFLRYSSEKWKQAPQWIREAARGALIMTNVTARSVGLVEPTSHQRIFWWHLFGCFTQFFMLPCFRRKQT